MRKTVSFCFLAVPSLLLTSLHAQPQPLSLNNLRTGSAEIGMPYLQNFRPKQYNAEPQNWAIVQDDRGVMYFGNNAGVLEYDGVRWRVIPTTKHTAVRALALASDGRIYVGAQGEIGYLAPDSLGSLRFVSLDAQVPAALRDFADIAKVYATGSGVYFQALDRLFLWSENRIKAWKPAGGFHLSFVVRDKFYIRRPNTGLLQMVTDSLQLLPGGERFAQERIYAMLPYGDTELLIATRNRGLFLADNVGVTTFPTEVDALLLRSQIYHAAVLSDGTFALATLRGGVVIIDAAGKLQQVLDKTVGVQDNNVKYVFPDHQNGLWLALDNGISRVEAPAPLSRFDERAGLSGSVEATLRHHGVLYAATGSGVYSLRPRTVQTVGAAVELPRFVAVSGIATQSWSLLSAHHTLLAATNDGVYKIQDNRATLIRKSAGQSFVLAPSQHGSSRVLIGLVDGLAAISYDAESGKWQDEGRISGVDGEVRSIAETRTGTLWLGTRSQGLIRVDFSGRNLKKPKVEIFDAESGLPEKHGWIIALALGDKEIFTTDRGIFRFDEPSHRFVPDSTFGAVFTDGSRIIDEIVIDRDDNVWLQSSAKNKSETGIAVRQPDGTYVVQTARFGRLVDFQVWSIYPEDDPTVVWFGGPDGVVRYDDTVQKDFTGTYAALVREVDIDSDSLLFGGAYDAHIATDQIDLTSARKRASAPPELAYAHNSLRFKVAAASYDDAAANQFQYFLDGFDHNWSEWTREPTKDYTNLPEGEYHFRVRAKNLYAQLSAEDGFAFEILAPWHRRWWAYTIYLAMLLVTVYGLIKLRTRQLVQRSRVLENTVEERTQEIRDKNQQLEKTLQKLQETQNQLVVQEKLASLGALTAGIAHEIKNPLNFVNNFAEISVELTRELRDDIDKEKDKLSADTLENIDDILGTLEQNAKKINEHGKRADSIVRGMLLHSRGKSGEREPTDINAMLDEDLSLAYHGTRAQDTTFNIRIEKDYDDTIGLLEVVPQDLSRVFLNLINNASYAANEKRKMLGESFSPTLSVRTKNLGDKIEIRIRDNGNGIPKAILDKIFNPFFTTKPTGQGTGLGLSISYDIIVQAHRGEIEVETEEGKFTEFVLRLPKV